VIKLAEISCCIA